MAMSTFESTEDDSYYYITACEFNYSSASWAIRCNGKVLVVDVTTDDLRGWSKKTRFVQLLQDAFNGDANAEDSLFNLIYEPCRSLLRTYAPETKDADSFTLQRYYVPEVAVYKLAGSGGKDIQAVCCRDGHHPMIASMSPQIALSDIPDAAKLLQLDASTIRPLPRSAADDVTSDRPAIVSVDDTAARYHFKSAEHRGPFLREVSILLQLRTKRLNKKYRLPTLHSLVYYSDKPDCILGMLIDRIDDGETLADWISGGRNPARSLKEKWNNQLRDIVRVLHRHDIIWGDVKPDNVVIDRDRNLWVIDFGGGYNGPYVDQNVMETIEGDLQGLSRMSVELLEGKKPGS